MIWVEPYVDLTYTLQSLKIQIIDSLDFASTFIPNDINTPEQLFDFLKSQVRYKKDPQGIEYIQTLQTLIKNGGRGDCDCFTVASIASLFVCGFKPLYVTIVGNNSVSPSHIYAEVYDPTELKIMPFDLTNPHYGMERSYKFKQRLKITL